MKSAEEKEERIIKCIMNAERKMDNYRYMVLEHGNNLYKYNHALFENMKRFMDCSWEINLINGTVIMLYETIFPEMVGKAYDYDEVIELFARKILYYMDRERFVRMLSQERLRSLKGEEVFEVHIENKTRLPEIYRIVLTPVIEDGGEVNCIYLSAKNIEIDLNRARQIEEDKRAIYFAMGVNYPCIMHIDLTENSCDAYVNEEIELEIPVHGSYDNAFEMIRGHFSKECEQEYAQQFAEKFNRGELTRHFCQSNELVEAEIYRKSSLGEHWLSIKAMRVSEMKSDEMIIVLMMAVIDTQKENERLSNLALQKSNEHLKRTLSKEEQYRQAIISGALLVYNINVSQNAIEDEIFQTVGEKRVPILALFGLQAPCSFDEFSEAWCRKNVAVDDQEAFRNIYNRDYLMNAFERGEVEIIHEFRTKAGRGIPILMRQTILLVQDEETNNVIALCNAKDVTAQREQEHRAKVALEEALEGMKRANEAKSDFLSHMSHDIRTPLNAIIGMTSIAGLHLDDRDRVEDCLNKICTASNHLLALVNEVLDMSKIESGRVRLEEEAFDLSEFTDNLIDVFRESLCKKNQKLKLHVNQVEHEYVIGDSLRLQQVFMNLMSNSVKYTPEGGKISLTITEKPSRTPSVGHYEFILEDTGIGMSKEFLGKMFDPFTRAEDSRISKIQGTGLGMSIARSIVSMMGGHIYVESELNKGTKFTVSLFLKLQDKENNHKEFADQRVLRLNNESGRDWGISQILCDLGMENASVSTGKELLETLTKAHEEKKDYYAVILDTELPDTDRAQIISEVRNSLGTDAPFFILISDDWTDMEQEVKDAGVDGWVSTPLFKSKVAAVMKDVTGSRRKERKRTSPLAVMCRRDYSKYRVLLAEDNSLNAEIMQEILKLTGIQVDTVRDGREAVDRFSASEPGYYQLIFMDIQMPVMNGYEAVKAIRALERKDAADIPVVAMTANAFSEDVQEAKSAGMNDHIAKPIDPKRLAAVLEDYLREPGL